MTTAIDAAIGGIQSRIDSLDRTAARIARSAPDDSTPGDLVQLMIDQRGVQANVAVLKTANEMLGSLLDVLA